MSDSPTEPPRAGGISRPLLLPSPVDLSSSYRLFLPPVGVGAPDDPNAFLPTALPSTISTSAFRPVGVGAPDDPNAFLPADLPSTISTSVFRPVGVGAPTTRKTQRLFFTYLRGTCPLMHAPSPADLPSTYPPLLKYEKTVKNHLPADFCEKTVDKPNTICYNLHIG